MKAGSRVLGVLLVLSHGAWAQEPDEHEHDPAPEPVPTSVTSAPARPKMAVLDVQVKNINPETGAIFTEVLTIEIDRLAMFDIISGSEIVALLGFEDQKQMVGCDDTSCMAELGGALGAELLVTSQVGLVGKTYVVSIKLINVKKAKTLKRVYESVEANVDKVLDLFRISVPRLFGKEAVAKPDKVSSAPAAKVQKTKPKSGVPVLPILLMAGGAVVGGVGGVLDGVALGHHSILKDRASTLAEAEKAAQDGQLMSTVAVVMYGVGAVTAVTGLVLFLISGDDEPTATALVPLLGLDTIGMTLSIRGW